MRRAQTQVAGDIARFGFPRVRHLAQVTATRGGINHVVVDDDRLHVRRADQLATDGDRRRRDRVGVERGHAPLGR